MIPEKDQLNMNKKNMLASIDVAMGGRAAEELFLGNEEITTGCSSDLTKATEMAYYFVKHMGMNENLSLLAIGENVKSSDKFNFLLDKEVQKMLKVHMSSRV
jgi:ATP-dependent metalloprotease